MSKVICTGSMYQIYGEDLKIFNKLPTQVYSVRFSENTGFFLKQHDPIEIKEDKIYGVHMSKVRKVINAFSKFNKNLGVILSGDKGIGKSLFAKILSTEAIKQELPVVIVDTYIPGIASFIESIDQEILVMFDEFDKTFGGVKAEDGRMDPQAELLTLFDGLAQGKKLFVITCNNLNKLNDYLVNRPGRFHYHFRFEYPSDAEIKEYLKDRIENEYHNEIEKVINFAHRVDLNYDCLRSIAFELNNGLLFEEAIKDLNILNLEDASYKLTLHLKDGRESEKIQRLDLFNKESDNITEFEIEGIYVDAIYKISSCEFNYGKGIVYVKGSNVCLKDGGYNDDDDVKRIKEMEAAYITIERVRGKKLHYAL